MKNLFGNCFHGVLLASLVILAGAQKSSSHHKDTDIHELARQNKITQQILQYYLQKRLGLARENVKPPSIVDILPVPKAGDSGSKHTAETATSDDNYDHGDDDNLQDVDDENLGNVDDQNLQAAEYENLQSVESEQVNSIYSEECTNCEEDGGLGVTRWTMPLLKLGEKKYYLGIFFKANWYKAQQYCRFHGMHLASISSQEENDKLEKYVRDSGFGNEHFWTSGTDLAEEGSFFWMANGRPLTFVNWNAGEPNNFRYENGEEENCLELWNRDGKGLKWNDSPCSFETFFICEVRSD